MVITTARPSRQNSPARDALVQPNEPSARAANPTAATVSRETRGLITQPPIPRPALLRGSRPQTDATGNGRRLDHKRPTTAETHQTAPQRPRNRPTPRSRRSSRTSAQQLSSVQTLETNEQLL